MLHHKVFYLIFVWLFAFAMVVHAQNEEKGAKRIQSIRENAPVNQKFLKVKSGVDTLRLIDRFAVRTNTVDWLLLIPNIGMEFDVKPVSWNRWTVGFNLRANPQTSHTYTHGIVYNLFEARLEGRQYWRARQINPRSNAHDKDKKHKYLWQKAISIRRSKVKHPTWTWFRGLYAGYSNYSFLFGSKGHQGTAITAGVSYGFLLPGIAGFQNGNTLDLEFGVWGGFSYVKDAVYTHDRESDCYPILEQKDWKFNPIPVISDVRIGLVYRLGNIPTLQKYRYRRDADNVYDKILEDRLQRRIFLRDSLRDYRRKYEEIAHHFWHVYDSIATADHANRSINVKDLQMPDEDAEQAEKHVKRVRQKALRRQAKAAEKEQKAAAKEQKAAEKQQKAAAKEEKKKRKEAAS